MATTNPTITYTELNKDQQIAMVSQRKLQLEQQYFQYDLRLSAPTPGDIVSETEQQTMAELAASINELADRLRTLRA